MTARITLPRILGWLAFSLLLSASSALLAQKADNIRWISTFTVDRSGTGGKLNITADIDFGFHIYGTKKQHEEIPTTFSIEKGFSGATIDGEFEPDMDPVNGMSPTGEPQSYYEGTITWSGPIKFPAGSAPPSEIPLSIRFQICDQSGCNLLTAKLKSRLAGEAIRGDVFRPEFAHAVFRGTASPSTAKPGQTIVLRIEAQPDAGWTIPDLIANESASASSSRSKPTFVVVNKSNGWKVHEPLVDKAAAKTDGALAWVISVDVPSNAEKKTYSLGGLVGLQAEGGADVPRPESFGFKVDIPVAAQAVDGETPISFEPGPSYEQVERQYRQRIESEKARAGQFANYSIPSVMALAFLAGFILNFMPCVLPVIGLKIMSFVQQAGENPGRIFLLNLAFAFGVMAVFMVLAVVASQSGWGGLFQSDTFQIVMIGVVFSFALSFLGVWEIPIPGMSGSSVAGILAARDGFIGAFVKGIITTLLATPCSGPLLVPTVIWALAQPKYLTYLTFAAMGLGMAIPYLLFGAFPRLVNLLPRPGNWMVTFKQLMGFAMLAAGIFLFGSLKEEFAIPTLSMVLAIGMACWVIGHTSVAAERRDKLKAWSWGTAIIALGVWVSFFVLMSHSKLEWDTFSKVVLAEKLKEGSVVFIDFTADW